MCVCVGLEEEANCVGAGAGAEELPSSADVTLAGTCPRDDDETKKKGVGGLEGEKKEKGGTKKKGSSFIMGDFLSGAHTNNYKGGFPTSADSFFFFVLFFFFLFLPLCRKFQEQEQKFSNYKSGGATQFDYNTDQGGKKEPPLLMLSLFSF